MLYLDSTGANRQYLIVRHEEQPIVVSLVSIAEIISRRNHQTKIIEAERGLLSTRFKIDVAERFLLKPPDSDCYALTISIRVD